MDLKTRQLAISYLTRFKSVEKHNIDDDPELETFCNEFLQASCFLWGCVEVGAKLIRRIHQHVLAQMDCWQEVSYSEAQLLANQNRLVIALWSDAKPGGDHGCIIIPGKLVGSSTYNEMVPNCANVGKDNFYGKKLSFAFPAAQKPTLYLWRGD